MELHLKSRAIRFAPIILPVIAIGLARLMTFTDWAAANATIAALLFAWIVADSLMLATIAKAPGRRPQIGPVLSAGAAASVIVVMGAAEPVRNAILGMPPLLAAAVLTFAAFIAWNGLSIVRAIAAGSSLTDAVVQIVPDQAMPLFRFMRAETMVMRLALFGWRRAQDIPAGAQGFSYHRYLLPMIWVLLTLQAIELGVMHLLLMQWDERIALVWSALGLAGGLWIVGLAQGFRVYPVLLTDWGLRVRSGVMVDVLVPYEAILGQASDLTSDSVKARDTLNQAMLSWPNVMLELRQPLTVEPLLGSTREVRRIALRIDDSAAFLQALEQRRSA